MREGKLWSPDEYMVSTQGTVEMAVKWAEGMRSEAQSFRSLTVWDNTVFPAQEVSLDRFIELSSLSHEKADAHAAACARARRDLHTTLARVTFAIVKLRSMVRASHRFGRHRSTERSTMESTSIDRSMFGRSTMGRSTMGRSTINQQSCVDTSFTFANRKVSPSSTPRLASLADVEQGETRIGPVLDGTEMGAVRLPISPQEVEVKLQRHLRVELLTGLALGALMGIGIGYGIGKI